MGLNIAGIDVIGSYDNWQPAVDTHNANFGHWSEPVDIRNMSLDELPKTIDFVVGSPPCTQFSFANRGGSGDIEDGLIDIRKMLEIVAHVQPKYWAMENVPRVAGILELELNEGGSLSEYRDLVADIRIVNCAEYGVPQRRKRMIAGRLPFDQLEDYAVELSNNHSKFLQGQTLGHVIAKLNSKGKIKDPLYGNIINKRSLTNHYCEDFLDQEEVRINREAKTYHPVYNKMRFPDDINTSARTVTATCTRVSRESIIVRSAPRRFRRLSIRERASLQSFPISFQFCGENYNSRLRMVGNAIPPLLTYFIGKCMKGDKISDFKLSEISGQRFKPIRSDFSEVEIEQKRYAFPRNRKFRHAIPGLRFGSGVRFELVNDTSKDPVKWKVSYYFGSSKNIMSIPLDKDTYKKAKRRFKDLDVDALLDTSQTQISYEGNSLQERWLHKTNNGPRPFKIIDELGSINKRLLRKIKDIERQDVESFVLNLHEQHANGSDYKLGGKYGKISKELFSGLLIGSWFNSI